MGDIQIERSNSLPEKIQSCHYSILNNSELQQKVQSKMKKTLTVAVSHSGLDLGKI